MFLHNLKDPNQIVDFEQAVKTGLGNLQGLFFPRHITPLEDIDQLLALPVLERNHALLRPFVQESLDDKTLAKILENTFKFPAKLQAVSENRYCLELFHGPTLAFKDFGASFMANCLQAFTQTRGASKQPVTILTATSGDTGAAVAHAFYQRENIRVVVLFPRGKISPLQQKMFTSLGDNIHTLAIDGDFDDCQALVKGCFDDLTLVSELGLNSANSINISRLLAQVCYYFDCVALLPEQQRQNLVVAVPSGNFGNLCAGMIGKCLGLPIKRFIAATNANDTVPRYLQQGQWQPQPTIATLSNAMDVSNPNNWPRIQYLLDTHQFSLHNLSACSVDEQQTRDSVRALFDLGYLSEPHAAVAYWALEKSLQPDEAGVFLGTAHPAKFQNAVETILSTSIDLPAELRQCAQKQDLSIDMAARLADLKHFLQGLIPSQ